MVGLVGESGAGKSSLMRAILHDFSQEPNLHLEGNITFAGFPLFPSSPRGRKRFLGTTIGSIPQEHASSLNPMMTVEEQLIEMIYRPPSRACLPRKWAREWSKALLHSVALPDPKICLTQYPSELNEGTSQRVVLAQALSSFPSLLLADEPTTALDTITCQKIITLLCRWRKRCQATLLLITHDLPLALQLCDRILILHEGKIAEEIVPSHFSTEYCHPHTAYLFGHLQKAGLCREESRPLLSKKESSFPLLECVQLTRQFIQKGKPFYAVDQVSFTLFPGEVVALIGESGSGKSTLARMLLRLLRPTSGDIFWKGKRIDLLNQRERRQWQRESQLILQEALSSFNPRMRVRQILLEPIRIHSIGEPSPPFGCMHEILEAVGLSRCLLDAFPHQLSAGQRQRINLARALMVHPSCIVCDEPTTSLDWMQRVRFVRLLQKLQHSWQFTCLFITHDLLLVRELANRLLVMHQGKFVECGPTEELLSRPRHRQTGRLLSAAYIVDSL